MAEDMQARGAAWLARMKREHASVPGLEYIRPGRPSIEWAATRGKTTFQIDRGGLGFETIITNDFIGNPEELLVEAEPTTPQAGDLIRETTTTEQITYEALAPGNEPCWRWTDAYRQRVRVHTKEIKREKLGGGA